MASQAAGGGRGGRDLALKCGLALLSFALTAAALELCARALLRLPAPVLLRDRVYLSTLPLVNGRQDRSPAFWKDGPRLSAKKEPGETRIFIFGESSVEGCPWGAGASAPTMLYDRLAGPGGLSPVTVVNMGRSGSFTMDAYYYLLAVREYGPDVVIFYIGANDRYDFEREMCLPQTHPRLYAAWRWLVEHSRLLAYVRILGPEKLSWPTRQPKSFSASGKLRCEPNAAFQSWTDLLAEAAASAGARIIVTSPIENVLSKPEVRHSAGKRSLSQEAFFAGLEPDYRARLRCLLSPGCDFAALLQPPVLPARSADRGFLAEARALLGCLRTPGCGFAEALGQRVRRWRERGPGAPGAAPQPGPGPGPEIPDTSIFLRRDCWERTASRAGAEFIDLGAFLKGINPGGLLMAPYIVDDVHLSPEGYWLLAGLWRDKALKLRRGGAREEGPAGRAPDLARYLATMDRPIDEILVNLGVLYLDSKRPLMACPPLLIAARKYHNRTAELLVGWLRAQAGLDPGLPPAQAAKLPGLNLADYLPRDYRPFQDVSVGPGPRRGP